jgi:type I restriction enzyme, S subunit
MTPDDVIRLKEQAVYQKNAAAWFFSKNDPRWLLSNMAGGLPVFWPLERRKENQWNSTEQLYQASKYGTDVLCRTESVPDAEPSVRNRIRMQVSPRGAKLTQKCAVKAGLVRADWEVPGDEVRVKAMLWVIELKLYWNPLSFGAEFRNTGEKPIVEISKKDDFWGCLNCANGELRGCNVLGKLLMDVRSRIDCVKRGNFTYPKGWLLP